MSDSDQPTRREYSRTDIISHIQRLADGDDPPTTTEFNDDDDAPAVPTVTARFDSWNDAVEATGFQPREKGHNQHWSENTIITHIQRLADGDNPPTQREFDADDDAPSVPTVRRYFGSWNSAIQTVGFQPREKGHNQQWSDDQILTHIQRLADGDSPPTTREFNADTDAPSVGCVANRFGTWNQAIQKAGLEPRTRGTNSAQWSDTDILTHIRRLADSDDPPTASEFHADDTAPSIPTVTLRFGSWNNAIEAAGFAPRPSPSQYIRDELLNRLIEYRTKYGEWPTHSDLTESSGPGPAAYQREFGTLTQALTIAHQEIDNE